MKYLATVTVNKKDKPSFVIDDNAVNSLVKLASVGTIITLTRIL